jgi:glutathione S-transferase
MTTTSHRILFHEYALSPFSEKLRRVFGYKSIAYASVDQPMWMPKPHLTPMTGGYRRIPVMQLGADVYCDTTLIARKIEQLHPDRPILPPALEGAVHAAELWADKLLFAACVPVVFSGLASMLPAELMEDRKRMRPELNPELLTRAVPTCLATLTAACDRLERTFAAQPFLLGKEFTLADAALFHCLWFVRNAPAGGGILARYTRLGEWLKRLETYGSGAPEALEAEEALAIARRSEPSEEPLGRSVAEDVTGVMPGDAVAICSDDLPQDVFRGNVVAITTEELVIERKTDEVGRIRQHFPRTGYIVQNA